MGWKNVKEAYQIKHQVQVDEQGICIGSPYIHDLIVIGLDGAIKKRLDRTSNADLLRYQAEFDADPNRLRGLVLAPDKFEKALLIYTYDGDKIIEKFCEALGYPNVTHDGEMMYEDMFFTDKSRAIKEAKSNSDAEIEFYQRRIKETKANLEKLTADMTAAMSERHNLEKDYPEKHEQ